MKKRQELLVTILSPILTFLVVILVFPLLNHDQMPDELGTKVDTAQGIVKTPYGNRIGPLEAYPNPQWNPGKLVDNLDINATLLNPNWRTSSIRPPVSYTNPLKKQQMQMYGDAVFDPNAKCMLHSNNPKCFEEDHECSIEIGGDPKSSSNLWPEPYNVTWNGLDVGAHAKDRLENYEAALIKSSQQTPKQACNELSGDWIFYAQKYGLLR